MPQDLPKILYVGLDPVRYLKTRGIPSKNLFHYPVIEINIRAPMELPSLLLTRLPMCPYLLFTSRSAVDAFIAHGGSFENKVVLSVGEATSLKLQEEGVSSMTASQQTQEGVIELIDSLNQKSMHLFWPRSSGARGDLSIAMEKRGHCLVEAIVYDPVCVAKDPKPNLSDFTEVVLTSPSCVKGFLLAFGQFPNHLRVLCIGPITKKAYDLARM